MTYLPGNRLWSDGDGLTVHIFDTISGMQVGTFTADRETSPSTLQYSATTNSVLVADGDRDAGGIFERDLNGALLREFHLSVPQTDIVGVTRGPGGFVFGTSGNTNQDVVEWGTDTAIKATFDVYPYNIEAGKMIWAGLAPEPSSLGAFVVAILCRMSLSRRHRNLC